MWLAGRRGSVRATATLCQDKPLCAGTRSVWVTEQRAAPLTTDPGAQDLLTLPASTGATSFPRWARKKGRLPLNTGSRAVPAALKARGLQHGPRLPKSKLSGQQRRQPVHSSCADPRGPARPPLPTEPWPPRWAVLYLMTSLLGLLDFLAVSTCTGTTSGTGSSTAVSSLPRRAAC